MSDASVRNLVNDGRLPEPRMELRRFGAHHAFRPTVVHQLADIEAYSINRIGQAPPPRGRHATKRARAPKTQSVSNITRQRQLSFDHLAQYDRHEPRTIPGFNALGPLVRRGYLRKTRGGYVRTAKEFNLKLVKQSGRRAKPVGASPRTKRATASKASAQAKRAATVELLGNAIPMNRVRCRWRTTFGRLASWCSTATCDRRMAATCGPRKSSIREHDRRPEERLRGILLRQREAHQKLFDLQGEMIDNLRDALAAVSRTQEAMAAAFMSDAEAHDLLDED
jgi:hypothetical protein